MNIYFKLISIIYFNYKKVWLKMPQLFQVLKCYKCLVFQIHQTKKSNKWQCKMCGEKQSMKRHYGLGTGKECRLHVQKLNGIRGEIEDECKDNISSGVDSTESAEDTDITPVQNKVRTKSKWSSFIENNEIVSPKEINEPMYLGDSEVCLEIPNKRVKSRDTKRKKISPLSDSGHRTNSFKTPYKYEFNDTSAATVHEFIKPVTNTEPSITGEITILHREVHSVINQGYEKKVLERTSKWEKFVDSADKFIEKDQCSAQNTSSSKQLFQLCDDTDLDEVLSI